MDGCDAMRCVEHPDRPRRDDDSMTTEDAVVENGETTASTHPAVDPQRADWLTPGPKPANGPSIIVTVPSGYDADEEEGDANAPAKSEDEMIIEVGDPHRVGDGLSKHIEYKVTFWTENPGYATTSGCVTRRYSDFEWLAKALGANCDGVIIPLLPTKTLLHMDDPSSKGIEKRRSGLALFMARVAKHPLMNQSVDLKDFLTQDSKTWSSRVPWYERGVLSDSVSSVTSWLSTMNTADMSASLTSSVAVDSMREKQQYIDTVDYVNKLKIRIDKLISAAKALKKHGVHTVKVYEDFNACLEMLAGQEDKARNAFSSNSKGVWWNRMRDLFVSLVPAQQEASDAMHSEFIEPLEEMSSLCSASLAAFEVRKRIIDHYNGVASSIERIEAKLSTMGVPEPGPKREEKQKHELTASDLRIERTMTHERYERCCSNMEHELVWFHAELATVLGKALKAHVAAQGAAAGKFSRVQDAHFAEIKSAMSSKPVVFNS